MFLLLQLLQRIGRDETVAALGHGDDVALPGLTIATGMVFVIRDFVQREMGHRVLILMALAESLHTPNWLLHALGVLLLAGRTSHAAGMSQAAGQAFGLSYDWFGRSSNPQNHRLTQHFAEALEKNGLIEERVDRMIYSIDDARFLPDRYVEGTCPHCGHVGARGDQCDNCGRLLDPTDLIDP